MANEPDTLDIIKTALAVDRLRVGPISVDIRGSIGATIPARATLMGDGAIEYISSLPGAEWSDWYGLPPQRHIRVMLQGVEFMAFEALS